MVGRTSVSLLKRLRDGDDAVTWHEFFDRYWRAMYMFAKRRGCSEQTAQDVVQEAILTVFEKRAVFNYDPVRGRFRNWLFKIVSQKLALYRRRQDATLKRPRDEQAGLMAEEPILPESKWEAAFEHNLLLALLEVVRSEVNPRTYQAFELTTLYEMPGSKVAKLTGMTRNAIYLSRKRVMQRLRELGASYRQRGELNRRIKQALELYPTTVTERAMTSRIETTMGPEKNSHHE